ncbi:unnamed protein product [Blepharisma stoltei]|uniref:Uncharacterized protein n=1 Tax=Blepharisma stoltei TaxID=1481888 RepID=A0AAU9INF9_9CILI|nr:unnamed protein product [Blepharisma stoltei]
MLDHIAFYVILAVISLVLVWKVQGKKSNLKFYNRNIMLSLLPICLKPPEDWKPIKEMTIKKSTKKKKINKAFRPQASKLKKNNLDLGEDKKKFAFANNGLGDKGISKESNILFDGLGDSFDHLNHKIKENFNYGEVDDLKDISGKNSYNYEKVPANRANDLSKVLESIPLNPYAQEFKPSFQNGK